jgi:DNA-binding response OmpR family regulator
VSSTDGITGTALAREHQIDTVVVNFIMPDLDGNQVTQVLLMKEHPTLPV